MVLAIVFAASAMVEGGIATWGVLYLRDHLEVGVLAGVGAYVVGQGLATITRIAGGPSIGALGHPPRHRDRRRASPHSASRSRR